MKKPPTLTNVPTAMGAAMGLPLPPRTNEDVYSEILSNKRTIHACELANKRLQEEHDLLTHPFKRNLTPS